ncbi:TetR/AcrR family transcriptional regulator [Sandaracinobacteroides saxicola]|uniref:TetR/AcrR family transcriptional regulator n=1 Tax=Sandaracinobacteroides saxicola TaxID=2759707 RepID=A0A7G5IJW0_9SPHN|nr:TetR/AcrR family transcriptional regulator [Sandaracinobacteroides saxicola]QMW23652.1 TetR/AcrR family transcriptional regulator [Sandaracinobacteroides saxicola]
MSQAAAAPLPPSHREPRTERGRRTHRAILDAAAHEFGTRGYHDTGITHITARAGVALGSFYTWFESKEAVFRALVADLSAQVRDHVGPHVAAAPDGLAAEEAGLAHFLAFARQQKLIYRIIDEAEFVAPDAFRAHYETTAARILTRLQAAAAKGEIRADVSEAHAWAIMGMNVFLGLRYGIWDDSAATTAVAQTANSMLRDGLKP